MKRLMLGLLKIVSVLVVLLVVLVGLLLLAGYYYLDPNLYKDQIITLVKDKTGRELTLDSRIEKSIYPFLGLKMGGVSLGNMTGFAAADPFLEIEKVEIGVRLMPIFRGRIEADKIRVSGLQLNLSKNKEGQRNWEDLLDLMADAKNDDVDAAGENSSSAPRADASTSTAEAPTPNAPADAQPLEFYFQGIELVNAGFTWRDVATGQDFMISEFDVMIPLRELQHPFSIKIKGRFEAHQPSVSGQLQLATEVRLNADFTDIELNGMRLNMQIKGQSLPEQGIDLNLDTSARFNTATLSGTLDPLRLRVAGVDLAGSIQITGQEPSVTGKLALAQTSPRSLLDTFNIPLPEMAGEQALSSLAAEFAFRANSAQANLDIASLTLDNSQLKGSLGVILGKTLGYRFNLEVDQLNLDDYLPPRSKEKTAAQPESEPFALDPALIDLMRGLDLAGEMRLQNFVAHGLKLQNIQLKVNARDGQVLLGPVAADLYNGTLQGNTTLNFQSQAPTYALQHTLQGFQIGPFTRDLLGKERVSGKTRLALDLKSAGLDLHQMKQALNGHVDFELADGAVTGVNIAHLLRTAQAKLKGQSEALPEEPLETDFTSLTGMIQVRDGVLENNNLSAFSPLLRISGKGTANLVAEEVNYVLTTSLVGTAQGQGGAELNELRGISIPVRASGPLLAPRFSLDLQEALKQKAVEQLRPKVEEKKEALQQEIKNRLPSQLRGLIK